MKNIALIFAGGSGQRMNSGATPKQFLKLDGKEIIIHTIEKFENHPEIDSIGVVCIEPWIDYLQKALQKNGISKVVKIVPGGDTGQESIYNGLVAINKIGKKSYVLVHDGVRPLIMPELISENIRVAREKGAAISSSHATETIVYADENNDIDSITDRSKCMHAKAPQTFMFSELWEAHKRAKEDNLNNFIDSASLMKFYGHNLSIVVCSPENIKITTPGDYYIFKALYEAREDSQIFGI